MRCALLPLLLTALMCEKTAASTFGYFLDPECTLLESLKPEDFCIETKQCKLKREGWGGDGMAYFTPLCAQTNEAIQALFPKGTKLFVNGYFKDRNCTLFKSPAGVYIVDDKCHKEYPGRGYRIEVESDKVVFHPYFSDDCSSTATSPSYHRMKEFDTCESGHKKYFLTGTGEAVAAPTPGTTPIADSIADSSTTSPIASKENAPISSPSAVQSSNASRTTERVVGVMVLTLLAYELA